MYYDTRQIRIILIVVGLIALVIALAAFGASHGSAAPASGLVHPVLTKAMA